MSNAAFGCSLCDTTDCLATRVVSVPTDATWTVDPELYVGPDCVDDAVRWIEAQPYAAGPAQVDPLSYTDGLERAA